MWTVGVPNQSLAGYTITGFVNGNTQTSLFGTQEPTVSCPTVNAANPVVGDYVINVAKGTLVAPLNYILTFQIGTLTV
jgi:hypothetical protein